VRAGRVPFGGVLAQLVVLPHSHDPGGDQALEAFDGQRGIALGIGAALGHVRTGVSGQQLEQHRLGRVERPLHRLFVGRAQDP
jgi:hypothetical protein